jgi:ribonuclease D
LIVSTQDEKPTELAFDLEAYNHSKYAQLTCLLQLSSNLGREYVIDTLADGVWGEVGKLAPIFADPSVVKVGHSIGGLDARCLHRDFGIFIVNVFDTYEASKVLNLQHHGLAAVCQYYGLSHSSAYTELKKTYQTTDWRLRPLTKEMILYGRYDVHYLLRLRLLMMRDLTHGELFNDDHAESRLVAESLAATLERMQEIEDGEEFGSGSSTNGSTYLSVQDNENDESGQLVEEVDGDSDDSVENDGGYFTPPCASSFDEYGYENGNAEQALASASEDCQGKLGSLDKIRETKVAFAEALRMQPRLMRVLSMSQERCRDLWTGRSEPYYRNPVFVSLMQRAKQNSNIKQHQKIYQDPLSKSQIKLYEDLVRLRAQVARLRESLPPFVCSLSDLALIAAGRPTNIDALRQVSYFLPESLQKPGDGRIQDDAFMKQIFVLTLASLKADGDTESPSDAAVHRYHVTKKCRSSREGRSLQIAKKMVLVSAICGGIVVAAVFIARRRRR